MNQLFTMLNEKYFYRISRSHIINLTFLQKVDRSKKYVIWKQIASQ